MRRGGRLAAWMPDARVRELSLNGSCAHGANKARLHMDAAARRRDERRLSELDPLSTAERERSAARSVGGPSRLPCPLLRRAARHFWKLKSVSSTPPSHRRRRGRASAGCEGYVHRAYERRNASAIDLPGRRCGRAAKALVDNTSDLQRKPRRANVLHLLPRFEYDGRRGCTRRWGRYVTGAGRTTASLLLRRGRDDHGHLCSGGFRRRLSLITRPAGLRTRRKRRARLLASEAGGRAAPVNLLRTDKAVDIRQINSPATTRGPGGEALTYACVLDRATPAAWRATTRAGRRRRPRLVSRFERRSAPTASSPAAVSATPATLAGRRLGPHARRRPGGARAAAGTGMNQLTAPPLPPRRTRRAGRGGVRRRGGGESWLRRELDPTADQCAPDSATLPGQHQRC